MRKAGIIAVAVMTVALFTSCSSTKSAGNGYFGVTNPKAKKAKQKEFQKPKHKIPKSKATKIGN